MRKVAVFVLCLIPAAWLVIAALTDRLSANPIKDITEDTGTWALRLLLVTLCVTPLRKLTGWSRVIKFRRMLGLFAFFYGCLHFLTYAWLDQFFSIPDMLHDVYKRPFITAGFTGFAVMIPLAITSTKKWIARLGGRRWQLLHRLTYDRSQTDDDAECRIGCFICRRSDSLAGVRTRHQRSDRSQSDLKGRVCP